MRRRWQDFRFAHTVQPAEISVTRQDFRFVKTAQPAVLLVSSHFLFSVPLALVPVQPVVPPFLLLPAQPAVPAGTVLNMLLNPELLLFSKIHSFSSFNGHSPIQTVRGSVGISSTMIHPIIGFSTARNLRTLFMNSELNNTFYIHFTMFPSISLIANLERECWSIHVTWDTC